MNFCSSHLSYEHNCNLLAIPDTTQYGQSVLSVRSYPSFPENLSKITQSFQAILEEELTGQFWLPDVIIPRTIQAIVSLSVETEASVALWHHITTVFKHDAIIVFTCNKRIAKIINRRGYTVVLNGNLNKAIKSGVRIWADDYSAVALLGALQNSDVLIWYSATRYNVLTKTEAVSWIKNNISWKSPFTGHEISISDAVQIVSDARRTVNLTRDISVCVGMSWWKKARIRAFFSIGRHPPLFRHGTKGALRAVSRHSGTVATWVSRVPHLLEQEAAKAGVNVCKVEDGFIRSVGLGSDFLPPSSIVVDRQGIYFDPSQASDLETILNTAHFDEALTERASCLIQTLIDNDVSKYAKSDVEIHRIHAHPGRRKILVPGQVSNDLSIRLGCGKINNNFGLLKAVRASAPDAHITFRPHPDVDAGHRPGHIPDSKVMRYADQIARGGSMVSLINQVNEVHTMTSLAGFEAILRGRKVVTYGSPFYAGWGITCDMGPVIPRRVRKLTLTELIAGTLILYPLYLDPKTQLPCGPELLIERMSDPTLWKPIPIVRLRKLQGRVRRLVGKILAETL
ncbi:beta-3-deoxy-D-manno-oct-2-ulosonic acid transferase [Saccharibacter sp. 17.LH.SD]|uniref:capsular polysaccharide export protein, LipB/KpsS family n=1 Tax=Saccharibacter sp. 17.LH.SD TaxID=2689393 RepID=UPI00136D97F7|nr:beta-3-deoxy-D-manno-oct-2-ulosonic acid transferase [Saccharibacter sp. 17.LH.SD]MXV45179.1 beta-3-deoxy-D-manno-oct-2-ulosonic acid transferase [Saccharibacter sp. 17.LH.SD]